MPVRHGRPQRGRNHLPLWYARCMPITERAAFRRLGVPLVDAVPSYEVHVIREFTPHAVGHSSMKQKARDFWPVAGRETNACKIPCVLAGTRIIDNVTLRARSEPVVQSPPQTDLHPLPRGPERNGHRLPERRCL